MNCSEIRTIDGRGPLSSKNSRRFRVLLACTAAFAATILLTAGVSPATVKSSACRVASCSGKYPTQQGCDDGRTIDRKEPGGGGPDVLLRVSARCGAAWAYMGKANSSWDYRIQGGQGTAMKTYSAWADLGRPTYTPMVPTNKPYRACIKGVTDGDWYCTPWH
ncbi:DUF2690 domain-containing protein [Streptomyces sp. NPDC059837]